MQLCYCSCLYNLPIFKISRLCSIFWFCQNNFKMRNLQLFLNNKFKLLSKPFSTSTMLLKKVQPSDIKDRNKSGSSKLWLSRQLSDPFVERAKMLNYRCRSAFKLLEIDEKYKIFQPGYVVIDCGASPGSWTQVAVQKVNCLGNLKNKPVGKVLSIDKQQIFPIEGATIFGNMDFTQPENQTKLLQALNGSKANVIISDMAPNASGIRDLDNENIIKLCYMALRFALQISEVGGSLVVKLWQCGDAKQLEKDILRFYDNIKIVKPKASRSDSAEIFYLGQHFKGLKQA